MAIATKTPQGYVVPEQKYPAIPEGGASGQVLAKKTSGAFDLEWEDPAAGGPGGVDHFTELADADTVNLPAVNPPLASALAAKVPTSRTIAGKPLSSDVTLAKADLGLSAVDNTSDMAKPVSTAQQAALDAKAPGGAFIAYGGTALTLTAAHNGCVIRTSSSSAVSVTVAPGLPSGFTCLVVQGGSGVVTAVGGVGVSLTANPDLATSGPETDIVIVPAGTNTYTVYSNADSAGATTLAELTDIVDFDLIANDSFAAVKATADAALAGGSTLAVIAGTRGTGHTLTATVASGWAGTFQWQSKVSSTWTNISGATSATYVEGSGEAARDIRCIFTPTSFTTNELAAPAGRITFTDSFTGANGDPPNARWTPTASGWTIQGNKLSYNGTGFGWVVADCTAGDNDFSVDIHLVTDIYDYTSIAIRYVDDNNAVYIQKDGADSLWKLRVLVAGVVVQTAAEATESDYSTEKTARVWSVGNTINYSINGVTKITDTVTQHATATKVALGRYEGRAADTFDNAVLA